MLQIIKNTNLIGKRSRLFCGVMFVAVIALLPNVSAQCTRWNAGITHNILQSGVKTIFIMQLKQKGNALTGTATIGDDEKGLFEKWKDLYGTAEGTIVGSEFRVQIFWANGKTGVYNGSVTPSGRLEGTAYEKATPNYLHSWHGKSRLECLPTPAAPPIKLTPVKLPADTLKPKPIKSSGKPKPAKAEPPPPMKVPGILASAVIYSTVGASTGLVVLTWDAGPDHPYAEVWYKMNNGSEIFLVEQGKGSNQMPVVRGQSYTCILIDAGRTLSTVNFVAQ